MNIKREELLTELYEFALGGNGMVVGVPGIGKSYLLRQLKSKLLSNDILCFIIKIDNTFDSSDDAISLELGFNKNDFGTEENWLEILKQVELKNEHKAVLIFDAFDAARDEEKRKGFIKQIQKSKSILKDKWNLLVSVRTYDATKSADLINLFTPLDEVLGYSKARKIIINHLKESEIQEASEPNAHLYEFYLDCRYKFREILHIPFFLKILETILSDYKDETLEEIKHYSSETQLLDLFWQKKIDGTKEGLLTQQLLLWFTRKLLKVKALSIPTSAFLESNLESQVQTFSYLRSENILDEVGFKKSRISFAHNLFFDYAVNRLCLDQDYDSFLRFLTEDYSRAFFLRPSFVYFFTSAWHEDIPVFWELYTRLSENNQKEIKLFVRLIINGTIASQYSDIEELKNILKLNGTKMGNESIRDVLQSIRFIRNKTAVQDISLINYLSLNLQNQYLFEFAFLLDRAISDKPAENYLTSCGESARNLLSYILANRNSEAIHFLDRIGSTRGIELVAKTFSSNPKKSADLLRKIFPLIDQPNFEIGYFTHLSEDIKYFVNIDPVLVSEVYRLIYEHNETSTEKTQLGTSVVMKMMSDRRQDFSMCHYRLEQLYPIFIKSSPEIAIKTGIEIINSTIIRDEIGSEIDQAFTFNYLDTNCEFYPDYSTIWSNSHYNDKPESLGEHITSYISEQFSQKNTEFAVKLILVYIANAKVGLLWKLLIKLSHKYPEQMFVSIMPLVTTPEFLAASEVSYEVRAFIEKTAHLLTDDQIKDIEISTFKAYPKDFDYGIHATLSTINPNRLQTVQAKGFMANKQILENTKPVSYSSSVTPYTTEDWLKDKGIDIDDPEVSEITESINYLDEFNHRFLNNIPAYEEYKPYLKDAFKLWEKSKVHLHLSDELKFQLLNAISKTVAISSRNLTELPDKDLQSVKSIVTYSFNYNSKYDQGQDENSAISGYSPTPRIEVAEAILPIFLRSKSSEILELYKNAMVDQSSVVRYKAIKGLLSLFDTHYDVYNKLLFERLEEEKDSFNVAALISSIKFTQDNIQEDGNSIIQILNLKHNLFQQQNQFVNSYAELLLWFLNKPEINIAFETLVHGYKHRPFSSAVIFHLFKQIHTYEPRPAFTKRKTSISLRFKVIENYIGQAGTVLEQSKNLKEQSEDIEKALHIFDEIIMRIHFALEANQRIHNNYKIPADEGNRKELYFLVKPLIKKILDFSSKVTDDGLLLGHTAHYLMQTLNSVLSYDPEEILSMVAAITKYSQQVGYSFDSFSIREIVSLTEKLLADHRDILLKDESFQDLLSILEVHINSGWVDALELLWRMDEVFK